MKNEIEVIDGVKGEWRTVTKPREVTVGQRCRYTDARNRKFKYGYKEESSIADFDIENKRSYALFGSNWVDRQAFFPLPVRSKRKVAKVSIGYHVYFWFEFKINSVTVCSKGYASRKSAIQGARMFCKAIGYECEIKE